MMNQRTFLRLLLIGIMVFGLVGCTEDGGTEAPLDEEFDSFNIGKADGDAGGFTACELREVLQIVNAAATDQDSLKDAVGLHGHAAAAIMRHRLGEDEVNGTADDNLIDDLGELDGIRWVGPKALKQFATFASPRCEIDLATRPFIHKGTFETSTGGGWGRDAPEFEAAFTLVGAEPRALSAAVNGTDNRGRPMFNRLRRGKIMEAFTYGYSIDEMPWDKDSYEAREDLPYLALSIENTRFVPDEDDNRERELSLGTDIFDDTYFDTKDFALYSEGNILRGRIRWDTNTSIRRLLVQAKSASSVDENGIKRAAKVDVRTDSPNNHVGTLNEDVMGGTVAWTGSAAALEPVKTIYDALLDANKLLDMQGYEKVLVLDPQAHLRSKRSRFHFNFTDDNNLESFIQNGLDRIQFSVDYAQAKLDAGAIDAADVAAVEALVAQGQGIIDGTLISDRALVRLRELPTPVDAVTVLPQDMGGVRATSKNEVDTHQIVAESAEEVMDEFADALDDLDRTLTDSSGLDGDDYVEFYVEFQKSLDGTLTAIQTHKVFKERYDQFVSQGDASIETQIETFNAHREQQIADGNNDWEDIEPMSRATFDALGKHLDFEVLKTSQRMIKNSGTVGNALWFELARKYYIPAASDSAWSNFLIDTFDVTYFITHEDWDGIPEDQRTPEFEIDGSVIFHTTVVNEVQIELTMIEPYSDRVAALTAEIVDQGSTPEREENLAGAEFILAESIAALHFMADLKGDAIVEELEDVGLKDIEWSPASYSKGITAMRILTDTDDGNP